MTKDAHHSDTILIGFDVIIRKNAIKIVYYVPCNYE